MESVGLENYANDMYGVGFGQGSQSEVDELNKALSAGSITGRETVDRLDTSGAAIKVESLEKTLKVVTFKDADIRLWKRFPNKAAYNTVEEYNRLVSYGDDAGGFTGEGELPETVDSIYQRKAQLVKFMGVTREVTHQMTLVNTVVGPIIDREAKNGTLDIMRKANRALVKADSTMIPVEWNGIYQQHREGYSTVADYHTKNNLVIDLRGAALTESALEDGVQRVIDNFGVVDTLFAPPIALSNFTKTFYQFKRQMMPVPNATTVGSRVTSFQSQFGDVALEFDKFLNRLPNKTTATPATHAKAPLAPTPDGVAPIAAVGSDASALWAAGDAGNYIYAVTGINRYGESPLAVLDGTPTAIAAGGAVDLKFTGTAGTYTASCFRIYRSAKGATSSASTTFYPLFDVAINGTAGATEHLSGGYDGGAAGVVRDRNRIMPETDQLFMNEFDEEIFCFKQLAPIMKMDLARLSPAYRFMILLYGTPILYQPTKMIKFINVGKS